VFSFLDMTEFIVQQPIYIEGIKIVRADLEQMLA